MNDTRVKNILLVKNRAIGDAVMGLSSIHYLRHIHPQANLYYGVPHWIAPLFDELNLPGVTVLPLSFSGVTTWIQNFRFLKSLNLDHVHELHQGGRSGKFFKFFSLLFGVKYSFHNHHLENGKEVIDQGVIKPLIQRDLDGICSFFKYVEIPNYLDFTPNFGLEKKNKKQVLFGVVATRETKMWPLEYFGKLATLISKYDSDIEILVPLSSSLEDEKIKKNLENMELPSSLSFVQVNLDKLPGVFEGSICYIGNDTGIKHLAVSLGIKSYTFFGPEDPKEWHPYDKKLHPYFFLEDVKCRTEKSHYCGLKLCDSMICLNQFLPEQVFNKIKDEL